MDFGSTGFQRGSDPVKALGIATLAQTVHVCCALSPLASSPIISSSSAFASTPFKHFHTSISLDLIQKLLPLSAIVGRQLRILLFKP